MATSTDPSSSPPLYLSEGLVAIHKPLTWTSNDVVSYIRGILERDAKDRGYSKDQDNSSNNNNKKRNRRKKQMMKVGHGGTLDPLASGVLVLGIGKGTTLLQDYLQGDKHYTASCHLGFETGKSEFVLFCCVLWCVQYEDSAIRILFLNLVCLCATCKPHVLTYLQSLLFHLHKL